MMLYMIHLLEQVCLLIFLLEEKNWGFVLVLALHLYFIQQPQVPDWDLRSYLQQNDCCKMNLERDLGRRRPTSEDLNRLLRYTILTRVFLFCFFLNVTWFKLQFMCIVDCLKSKELNLAFSHFQNVMWSSIFGGVYLEKSWGRFWACNTMEWSLGHSPQ